MKKLIAILVCLAVLTFAGTAFAKGFNGNRNILYQASKVQSRTQAMNQVRTKVRTVQNNEAEIRRLKIRTEQKIRELKIQINRVKQNPSRLTPEKAKNIKVSLSQVKEAYRSLESTRGMIRSKELQLRGNRNKKNLNGFLQNLDGIISIQNKRIRLLNDTLEQLEELRKSLA